MFTDDETVNGNGDYTTNPGYVTTFAGTIFWIASYSGDASNTAATGSCGDANESSAVAKAEPDIVTLATAEVTVGRDHLRHRHPVGRVQPDGHDHVHGVLRRGRAPSQVFTDDETVNGNGDYTTNPGYVTTAAGTIFWIAVVLR